MSIWLDYNYRRPWLVQLLGIPQSPVVVNPNTSYYYLLFPNSSGSFAYELASVLGRNISSIRSCLTDMQYGESAIKFEYLLRIWEWIRLSNGLLDVVYDTTQKTEPTRISPTFLCLYWSWLNLGWWASCRVLSFLRVLWFCHVLLQSGRPQKSSMKGNEIPFRETWLLASLGRWRGSTRLGFWF